jgi:23S rRNA (guanosine2251-2'-O)-methyltransferase
MRKLTHAQIVDRQVTRSQKARMPVVVVLDNIRSLHNVGAIFRTADGAGIEKIWLCGITGYPPQGEISKTALGAEESVAWEYVKDIMEVIRQHKAHGYQVVLLEQVDGSTPYDEFIPDKPVCLVVGNEVDGIVDKLEKLADVAVEIPMAGVKNSLNVAVAFGVVAFHLTRVFSRRRGV